MYLNLMQAGYKIHEIDQMDMVFYMRLQAHALKEQKVDNQTAYIDQIGIF